MCIEKEVFSLIDGKSEPQKFMVSDEEKVCKRISVRSYATFAIKNLQRNVRRFSAASTFVDRDYQSDAVLKILSIENKVYFYSGSSTENNYFH